MDQQGLRRADRQGTAPSGIGEGGPILQRGEHWQAHDGTPVGASSCRRFAAAATSRPFDNAQARGDIMAFREHASCVVGPRKSIFR